MKRLRTNFSLYCHVVVLLVPLLAGCAKPAKAPMAKPKFAPPPVAEVPFSQVPRDQEVSVNLIYAGEVEGKSAVGFDFRVYWGEWKSVRKELQMASHSPQPAKLDLGTVDAKVVPVFGDNKKGQYDVKVYDKAGRVMGDFRIAETGKQVKLGKGKTPGYISNLEYFDQTRYITAYTLTESDGRKLGESVGVLFVGQGWQAVDASKRQVVEGPYSFPKVDMVLLPAEWMAENEVKFTFRTLKCGTANPAGVGVGGNCYS